MDQDTQKNPILENSLEKSLSEARAGSISINEFLQKLFHKNIFVLSFTSVEGDGSGINQLVFNRDGVEMVAIFTSLLRTDVFSKPEMYFLQIQGTDFLQRIPKGFGLVLNPGSTLGLEIPTSGVEKMQRDFCKNH